MPQPMTRLRIASPLLLVLILLFPAPAASGPLEIVDGKHEFMRTLASMPYTSSGRGPILYVLEFSECPYCQAFERDWKGKLGDIEVRRFFYGVSDRTVNETAYLARTRDIEDFYAFMARSKVAPSIRGNNAAIDAYNSVARPLQKIIVPIMRRNGWPNRNPVSPQFMWERNGRVFVFGGYSLETFREILASVRARAGSGLPQPNARYGQAAAALVAHLVLEDIGGQRPSSGAQVDGSDLQQHVQADPVGGDLVPDRLGIRRRHTPDLRGLAVAEPQGHFLAERVELDHGARRKRAHGEFPVARVVFAQVGALQ